MTSMKSTVATSLVAAFSLLATNGLLAQDAPKEKPKSFKPVQVKAVKAATAPKLDGVADDAAWKSAPAVEFTAVKGRNFKDGKGETTGTIKVVYTSDMIYMLVQYDDPTLSARRAPYQKQDDGTWKKLADPDDKGGDNNVYYEDKLAVLWNINDSIFGFNERFSCQAACHSGEPGKPYGNKYTGDDGEIGDLWHLKYVRTAVLGQVDDGYLDNTPNSEKDPNAGRKSDPKTGGGYDDIKLVNGKPEFMNKDGKPANKGGTYWLKDEEKAPFDDAKFKPGDEVSSILVAPFVGDRGDVQTSAKWANGKWTIEIARKLVTGSKFDVNFSDLNKGYGFGLAVFDNAQVRHAFVQTPLILSFEK